MRVDLHQHVWTAPLLDCLAERDQWPFVRRENGVTVVHCAAEQPYVIDELAESAERRNELLRADGIDLAVVGVSSPIGIEALPRAEAVSLLSAHLDGVEALGPRFAAWGPVALDEPDPDDVDRLLARGSIGISIPAGALAGAERLASIGPLLQRVGAHAAPLFVHPGRAPGDQGAVPGHAEPVWWRALTDYVSQMQAAWFTFMALGRREHPELMVVFAMLAGGAPLQSERLSARGGPIVDLRDPLVFYETSSYGPATIELLARLVGERQLLYGSDRPVIEPVRTGREVLLAVNAAALLARSGRSAVAG